MSIRTRAFSKNSHAHTSSIDCYSRSFFPFNARRQGVKLEPFSDARVAANQGCGITGVTGTNNGAAYTVQRPTQAFRKGTNVQIQWSLTIPHNDDRIDTGIRVAVHFGPGDSFECNILTGGLEGDPDFDITLQGSQNPIISAGPPDAPANALVSTLVTLPANKTCDYCVLQWTWAARTDGPTGGYYISCADIAITESGNLPSTNGNVDAYYATLPQETGELPLNQVLPANQGCEIAGGGAGAAIGIVIAVIIVLALAAAGYCYFCKGGGGGGGGGGTSTASAAKKKKGPAPPPAPTGPEPLPAGWTASVDPSSGRTYYVGPGGQTSWEKPQQAPAPPPMPPPPPPGEPSMPPGWTSSVDPSSGATYYVGPGGVTTWEHPGGGRV